MWIFEVRGEEALDALGDLISPAVEIMADERFANAMKAEMKIEAIEIALKNHKKSILEMLAVCNHEDVETFASNVKITTLPKMLVEFFSEPEIEELFMSQSQSEESTSGSATQNITETPQ